MWYGPERLKAIATVWRRRLFTALVTATAVGFLAGTIWVLVLVGSGGRGHLPTYLWASYLAAGGWKTEVDLSLDGERYYASAPEVRDYLEENIYEGRTASDLFAHWTWGGFLAFCITVPAFGFAATRREAANESNVVRGRRLISASTLQRRILGIPLRILGVPFSRKFLTFHEDGFVCLGPIKLPPTILSLPKLPGIHIAGISIPERDEPLHIMALGDTGQGKTTILYEIAHQLRPKRRFDLGRPPVVIYDPEREFLQEFYDEEYDTILNPFDVRSPVWSPWDEIHGEGDIQNLVTTIIPSPSQEGTSADFFARAARAVLRVLLERIAPHDIESLADLLSAPAEEIKKIVQGTPAANMLGVKAESQAAGVLGTLAIWADVFRTLKPISNKAPRWSASDWMVNPKGWVFLARRESEEEAVLPLHTVWLDTLIRRALDRPKGAEPIWFILDELTTLRKLNSFPKLLERGRKRSVRVAFCAQAGSQIEELYGRRSKSILSQAGTKILFRVSEPSAAKWASECVGEKEYLEQSSSLQVGGREGLNVGETKRIAPVVLPTEVQSLKQLSAFFVFEEWVSRVVITPPDHQPNVPDFLPRPQIHEKASNTEPFGTCAEEYPQESSFISFPENEDHLEEDDAARDPLEGLRID